MTCSPGFRYLLKVVKLLQSDICTLQGLWGGKSDGNVARGKVHGGDVSVTDEIQQKYKKLA